MFSEKDDGETSDSDLSLEVNEDSVQTSDVPQFGASEHPDVVESDPKDDEPDDPLEEEEVTTRSSHTKTGSDRRKSKRTSTYKHPWLAPPQRTEQKIKGSPAMSSALPSDQEESNVKSTADESSAGNAIENKTTPSRDIEGKAASPSLDQIHDPPEESFPNPPIYSRPKSDDEFKDCYDHYTKGRRKSASFTIQALASTQTKEVFCDMKNGGWTLIQRRRDGSVDFFRNWTDYTGGFGNVLGEHWIGNEVLHQITNQDHYSLRIDMTDWERQTHTVVYDRFRISDESDSFRIFVDGYGNSSAGDSLSRHHGSRFSTTDVDNDLVEKEFDGNCARRFGGAWWYYSCYKSNLNGRYYRGGTVADDRFDGVAWKSWRGSRYSLKKVEMKIRPKSATKKK